MSSVCACLPAYLPACLRCWLANWLALLTGQPHPSLLHAWLVVWLQVGANMNKQAFKRYLKTMGWNEKEVVRRVRGGQPWDSTFTST